MRRAMAALACLPDEDTEVPSMPDLEAPPAGCATVRAVGDSTAGGATVGVTTRTIARTTTAVVAGEAGAVAAFTARAGQVRWW
jgi:hypothetical protein